MTGPDISFIGQQLILHLFGIGNHCSEFVHSELALIQPYADLAEKQRATRTTLISRATKANNGDQVTKSDRRDYEIENSFGEGRPRFCRIASQDIRNFDPGPGPEQLFFSG